MFLGSVTRSCVIPLWDRHLSLLVFFVYVPSHCVIFIYFLFLIFVHGSFCVPNLIFSCLWFSSMCNFIRKIIVLQWLMMIAMRIKKLLNWWEARGLTIIKHPGERSLKSYSKLFVVNSGNYYLDRLTADVDKGDITYDVFNYGNYINYNAIFIFNNVPNHEKMQ